jgi:predicted nucleic acid-binding protein
MTEPEKLAGARSVFLETSVLIYYIESHPKYASLVAPVIDALDQGTKVAFSSYVALFEVLTKPFELGRQDLIDRYKDLLLKHPNVRIRTLEQTVAEEGARLRAQYKLKKAPDAIQLATAGLEGVEVFLTNDRELKRVKEVPVVVLDDLA